MKKITILFLSLIFISLNELGAQSNKVGFKAGGNFSNFHGDDADANMKTGFHVGGFVTTAFGNLAVQPEILISTKGAKWEEASVETYTNLLYIDVPILLKFYMTENINLHLGPQFGFLISASQKKDPEPQNYDEDASEFYETLDYGAVGGLEFDSNIGFVIGARYYYGLAQVQEDVETEVIVNNISIKQVKEVDIKNSMVQVYVGIGF